MISNETYLDTLSIMDSLKNYASPRSKLSMMVKEGKVESVRRGLYLPGNHKTYSIKTLGNIIYGPSYLSFEYALSYHGAIPERVASVTLASYNKNRTKTFHTPKGSFIYRPIPKGVYFYETRWLKEGESPFLMATLEKALCDTLYGHRYVKTLSELLTLLHEDLRIDSEIFESVNLNTIETIAPLYKKKVLTLFVKWLRTKS